MFFVGLHQPSDAKHFERSFVSVNRLRKRKSDFPVANWIMDSGAFTEISTHGHYRDDVKEYARQIERWRHCGKMLRAVAQDWMCEPFIVAKTGLSVEEHQRRTIDRYRALRDLCGKVVMPVLQGFTPLEYLKHLEMYGQDLNPNQWVGVGSICKRNSNPSDISNVLGMIKQERPDLRLHGFGLKKTALMHGPIRGALYSADSMAWSFAARRQNRNANDWREAKAFENAILNERVSECGWQYTLAV